MLEHHSSLLEAILFSHSVPVNINFLAEKIRVKSEDITSLINNLNERYKKINSSLRIRKIGNSYQMVIDSEFVNKVKEFLQDDKKRLTRAQLETLAIIAYKQPITVSEIEDIRGSFSRSYVLQLVKIGLVTSAGKSEEIPGKPVLYTTTEKFLEYIGISSLEELPDIEDFHF